MLTTLLLTIKNKMAVQPLLSHAQPDIYNLRLLLWDAKSSSKIPQLNQQTYLIKRKEHNVSIVHIHSHKICDISQILLFKSRIAVFIMPLVTFVRISKFYSVPISRAFHLQFNPLGNVQVYKLEFSKRQVISHQIQKCFLHFMWYL